MSDNKVIAIGVCGIALVLLLIGVIGTQEIANSCATNNAIQNETSTGDAQCINIVHSINTFFGDVTVSGTTPVTVTNSLNTITIGCATCLTGTTGVSSISNIDGTLTISPTVGNVIASLALGHANTWTGLQTFNNAIAFTSAVGCPSATIVTICYHTSPAIDMVFNMQGSNGGFVFQNGLTILNLSPNLATLYVPTTILVTPNTQGLLLEPNATGSSPFIQFADSGSVTRACLGWQSSPSQFIFQVGTSCATIALQIGSGGNIGIPNGIINNYNGITTKGNGVCANRATYSQLGKVAAVTNAINYVPPATAGTYELKWTVDVTAATTDNFHILATWKDASGNSESQTIGGFDKVGTSLVAGAITNTIGVGTYYGFAYFQINNGATAITLSTAGTFTSVTYNLGADLYECA